jgi:hypothetical protein
MFDDETCIADDQERDWNERESISLTLLTPAAYSADEWEGRRLIFGVEKKKMQHNVTRFSGTGVR